MTYLDRARMASIVSHYFSRHGATTAEDMIKQYAPARSDSICSLELTQPGAYVRGQLVMLSLSPILVIALSFSSSLPRSLNLLADRRVSFLDPVDVFIRPAEDPLSYPFPTLLLCFFLEQTHKKSAGLAKDSIVPTFGHLIKMDQIDLLRPLSILSFATRWSNLQQALGLKPGLIWELPGPVPRLTLDLSDEANVFYLCCQTDHLLPLTKFLLDHDKVRELFANGRAKQLLFGPKRRTLIMAAAAAAPETLMYLIRCAHLLADGDSALPPETAFQYVSGTN